MNEAIIPTLKIGFIGTGATGKTSVAELLRLDGIPEEFRPSIVRGVMEKLNVIEGDQKTMSPDERWSVQSRIMEAKLKQDDKYEDGLFDRTPVDHLAYCLFRCAEVMTDQQFEELIDQVEEYTSRYDLIFYFPLYSWTKNVPSDGFRQTGFAYRLTIDLLMQQLLGRMELEYHVMPDDTPEVRCEFIKDLIELERIAVMESDGDDTDDTEDDDDGDDQDAPISGDTIPDDARGNR